MRLIDADPFDKLILPIPEDVYDATSFLIGVESVLKKVRESATISDPRFDPRDPQFDPRKAEQNS